MWTLIAALSLAAFACGLLCGPTIHLWINGAEAELADLRDRARRIEAALSLAARKD